MTPFVLPLPLTLSHANMMVILAYFLLPLLTAAYALYYCFYFLRRARTIEDMPVSKIRSAAQGYVELSGRAWPLFNHQILTAKLSKKSCLWYRYIVEEKRVESTKNGTRTYWVTVQDESSHDCFLIQDNTGNCIVIPLGAEMTLPPPQVWKGFSKFDPPLPPTKLWAKIWHLFGPYRYTEYRLDVNAPLYVTGVFTTYREEDLKNFIIAEVSRYREQNALKSVYTLSAENLPAHYVFLISTKQQNQMVRLYQWKSFAYFVVFVFLICFPFTAYYTQLMLAFNHWVSQVTTFKPRP